MLLALNALIALDFYCLTYILEVNLLFSYYRHLVCLYVTELTRTAYGRLKADFTQR